MIGATIASILPQLDALDRLIVVADNCSDRTAVVAREAGAIVIERQDALHRGKGHALDFGVRFLDSDPPEVLVLMDADCEPGSGVVDRICRLAAESQRPVQAVYLMELPPQPSLRDMVSAFAFRVKNLVRPAGLRHFGMPCLLTGTGMAFPWPLIRGASLASSNIVEDMQLGLDMAIAGGAPLLASTVEVRGRLPQDKMAALTQRRRWEHGHLRTLTTQVPRLLFQAAVQRRLDLLATGLDLCVPPLSLLVTFWAALMAATTIARAASPYAFFIAAASGVLLATAVLTAWARFGRDVLPARMMVAVPFYILWKLPLYAAFPFRREKTWVRTERDSA